MPLVFVDNKPYQVKDGANLLEASLALGFDLPYFCWHPALGSVGACRQCAVLVFKDENDSNGRLAMSCMEPVREGLRISIEAPRAKIFREQIIEWLMTNHPHDCPVCDEGGSCHLQDMTVMTGHDYRRYDFKKRTHQNQYLGPLIHHEMNRCIQCYRCVRFYRDYAGGDDLNVFAAHHHVYFGREKDGVLQSPFSGNLSEICPTGVFTDKTLKEHYTRKWDLVMSPSICQHCSVGCNTIAGERYGEIRCIQNRYHHEVNGYFLCDRGRFGYEFVNSENRIRRALVRSLVPEAVEDNALMAELKTRLRGKRMIGIGSGRASVESNFALRELVGENNFYAGVSAGESVLHGLVVSAMQSGAVQSVSLKDIEHSDAILILGEDVWNTAPMMALAIRRSVLQTEALNLSQQASLPSWHQAAVSEFAQERMGFLANITVAGSPLDNIAAIQWQGAPDDIARLGFAIAHHLNNNLPVVSNLNEPAGTLAGKIAASLRQAKHPVVICGISSRNEHLVRAAFNIAALLAGDGRKAGLAYVLPECNSMGLAMMHAPSFEMIADSIKSGEETVALVLENNLYQQAPATVVDRALNACNDIIVLNILHNATTEKAAVLLPTASFAEGNGTIVNYEGRAQWYCRAIAPNGSSIRESWKWLEKIRQTIQAYSDSAVKGAHQVLKSLEQTLPQFEGISKASPVYDFSIHGEKIPRAPHRYSGRTAVWAGKNVSEPKPVSDDDTPFSFTMEGYRGVLPSGPAPFFWSPGWNSVQSLAKFQKEPGGELKNEKADQLLFANKSMATHLLYKDIPEAFLPRLHKWLVLPQYHALGDDEMSVYTEALRKLSNPPAVMLSADDARALNVQDGMLLKISDHQNEWILPLLIRAELINGLAMISAGIQQTGMPWGSWMNIEQIEGLE